MPSNPKHLAKGRKLAPHVKRGIVAARANGMSYVAIAKRFGVGVTTAWRIGGKNDDRKRPKQQAV
jgi:DNA invertase Pin-like site-specific DNA recombinase